MKSCHYLLVSGFGCQDSWQSAKPSNLDVVRWMFDVLFFITKSRKDETTKNTSENFVLFSFRVFVIQFFESSEQRLPVSDLRSPISVFGS
jgi:hypothetical protein